MVTSKVMLQLMFKKKSCCNQELEKKKRKDVEEITLKDETQLPISISTVITINRKPGWDWWELGSHPCGVEAGGGLLTVGASSVREPTGLSGTHARHLSRSAPKEGAWVGRKAGAEKRWQEGGLKRRVPSWPHTNICSPKVSTFSRPLVPLVFSLSL